jgi:uncharacterized membrane protein
MTTGGARASSLQLPSSFAKRVGLFGLAAFFIGAGVNHFANPEFYVAIMPPYLPAHLELVYLSGALEILGGVGVLVPALRSLAGWGLVALLVAVYPANVHMALHPEQFSAQLPAWAIYARLPFQFVFLAWAIWATRPD